MSYLYETHCHCAQCSQCAVSPSPDIVRAYQAAGYAGLVLTDHFIFGNTAVDRTLPWEERMHRYYDAYLEAKAVGDELDFDVIFGIEHHYAGGKEFLLYGIGLEFLLANPDIPEIPLEELIRRVHAAGGLAIHAHPYRARWYIDDGIPARTDLADGIEIYNGCNRPGEDRQALALAQKQGGILTSGGDIHDTADPRLGRAGLLLPHRVRTGAEFVQALRQGGYGFRVEGRDLSTVTMEDLP